MRYNCFVHVEKNGLGIEGYHKHYKQELKPKDGKMVAGRALIHRQGHSKYYKDYKYDSRFDKLKTWLHAIDWSLDKFLMDARANKLSSKDTIIININNKELVPILNQWSKSPYFKDDVLVNRELFTVLQTIKKIRQKSKVGIRFEFVKVKDNNARKLVGQYEFKYNRVVKPKMKCVEELSEADLKLYKFTQTPDNLKKMFEEFLF